MRWPVVYLDFPWKHDNYGMKKHGAAKAHYPEMSLAEGLAFPMERFAAPKRALCFLWCTGPKGAEGAHHVLLNAWGFRCVTKVFTWVKVELACVACGHDWNEHEPGEDLPGRCRSPHNPGRSTPVPCFCRHFVPKPYHGTGNYTAGGTEDIWLGVRGSGWSKGRLDSVRHTVMHPLPCYPGTRKGQHSAKPEEFARRIERLVPGPYVELFARRTRPGWAVYGDQAPDSVQLRE